MDPQEVQPGRGWYAVAIAIPILGVGLFIFMLWSNLNQLSKGLIQVVAPGEKEIILTHPGKYTIFQETQTTIGNQVYHSSLNISGLRLSLSSLAMGASIPLAPPAMSQKYSLPGREGVAAFDFSIDYPGAYLFSANYPSGENGGQVVFSIGQGFMKKLFITLFGGISIIFGSIFLGTAIALITYLKRRKALLQIEVKLITS